MKEREKIIDGRSRNRFQSIFRDQSLLESIAPSIPNLSPNDLKKKVEEKCALLERELGLVINPDHREEVVLTLEHGNQMGAILIEAGCFPLLDDRQESVLTRRVIKGKRAIFRLKQFNLRAKKDDDLVETTLMGAAARKLLICCNLRLVINRAKKYKEQGILSADLIQEGTIALIRAVERFELDSGTVFSTYATNAIDRQLEDEIAKSGYLARVPRYLGGVVRKIHGARDGLLQELKREPTDEEIARRLGMDPEAVTRLLIISQPPLSLDIQHKDGERSEFLYELIKDEGCQNPEEAIAKQDVQEQVSKIITSLPQSRVRQILEMRFGLNGQKEHELDEIGQKFGITGERVRQIENKMLAKLKTFL